MKVTMMVFVCEATKLYQMNSERTWPPLVHGNTFSELLDVPTMYAGWYASYCDGRFAHVHRLQLEWCGSELESDVCCRDVAKTVDSTNYCPASPG